MSAKLIMRGVSENRTDNDISRQTVNFPGPYQENIKIINGHVLLLEK